MAEEKDSSSIPLSAAGGVDGGIDPEDPAKSPPTSPISTRKVRGLDFRSYFRLHGYNSAITITLCIFTF